MADKKAKFVVIKPNTLNHEVGDVIDLTAKQAKNLTGKVRLAKDVAAAKKSQEAQANAVKLAKENEELKGRIAELEKELKEAK